MSRTNSDIERTRVNPRMHTCCFCSVMRLPPKERREVIQLSKLTPAFNDLSHKPSKINQISCLIDLCALHKCHCHTSAQNKPLSHGHNCRCNLVWQRFHWSARGVEFMHSARPFFSSAPVQEDNVWASS